MESGQNDPPGAPAAAEPVGPAARPAPEPPNRIDWERNHEAIKKVIVAGLNGDGMPTLKAICEATGLSLSTVKHHLSTLKANSEARFEKFQAATEEVLIGMYRAGKKGDARAGKLWLQFVESWEERKRITSVGHNPYRDQTDEALRKVLAERLAQLRGGPVAPAP